MQTIGKWQMSPCSLRMPMVVASDIEALATQLSRNGLEEIWSPYTQVHYVQKQSSYKNDTNQQSQQKSRTVPSKSISVQ